MPSVQASPRSRSFDSAIPPTPAASPRSVPAPGAQTSSPPKHMREMPAAVVVAPTKVCAGQHGHLAPPPGTRPSPQLPGAQGPSAVDYKTLTIAVDIEALIQTEGPAPFSPHLALPALQKFLRINATFDTYVPRVEVVLLCHAQGKKSVLLRALREANLPVERVLFANERPLLDFLQPFEAMLYLSCDPNRVRRAVAQGIVAGCLLAQDAQAQTGAAMMANPTRLAEEGIAAGGLAARGINAEALDSPAASTLQVAFDFDGVFADDLSEIRFKTEGLEAFHAYEDAAREIPMGPGPAQPLALALGALRDQLAVLRAGGAKIPVDIRISVVTARGGVAIERLFCTLEAWNFEPDEVFCLGGRDKTPFLRGLKADLYLDDQMHHALRAKNHTLAVHMPTRSSILPPQAGVVPAVGPVER